MKYLNYIIIGPVRGYQKFISPLIGPNCRYHPTCSQYMIEAVTEWGLLKGGWLGVKRICSCHPWGGMGEDLVPRKKRKEKV